MRGRRSTQGQPRICTAVQDARQGGAFTGAPINGCPTCTQLAGRGSASFMERHSPTQIKGYEKLFAKEVCSEARERFIRVLEDLLNDPDLQKQGIVPVVTEVYRTPKRQKMLYAQGRTDDYLLKKGYTLDEIIEARKAGYTAEKPIVTNTLSSKHIDGRAMDITFAGKDGKPHYEWPNEVWQKYGDAARKYGLEWGGDWKKFSDRPHVEYNEEKCTKHEGE